jgi:hypothetical protein
LNTVDPEAFLADQIERRFWSIFPSSLRSAYSAVDQMVAEQPILQVVSAEQNRGRLVSWATDLAVVRAINTGALPFDFEWRSWDKPTGRYLAIRLSHSVMSLSQVPDANRQPRTVKFRENGRLNNSMLFPFEELEEEIRVRGLPHFLLIHGYQELNFVHLAVPHPTSRTKFSYRTPNLLDLPHAVSSDLPPVEDTEVDLDAVIGIREEIEKWMRDNGTDD